MSAVNEPFRSQNNKQKHRKQKNKNVDFEIYAILHDYVAWKLYSFFFFSLLLRIKDGRNERCVAV